MYAREFLQGEEWHEVYELVLAPFPSLSIRFRPACDPDAELVAIAIRDLPHPPESRRCVACLKTHEVKR